MLDQFKMRPQELRNRGDDFKRAGGDIERIIGEMGRWINDLKVNWEGQAAQKFEQQFMDLKPHFNNMQELVTTISQQLHASATYVEEVDREMAQKFGVQ